MTIFSKHLGGAMAPLAPHWLRLCLDEVVIAKRTYSRMNRHRWFDEDYVTEQEKRLSTAWSILQITPPQEISCARGDEFTKFATF